MQTTDINLDKLKQEAGRLTKQLNARYSESLIRSRYKDDADFQANVVAGLSRSGISGDELHEVREWLIEGLKPFVTFPPTIEAIIHLARLLRNYPRSSYDKNMKDAWYRIDRSFGHKYSKYWKDDNLIDSLEKERVWLSSLFSVEASQNEVIETLKKIESSGHFRSFPPSLDQFIDALVAVRHGFPLVEEAWIMAVSDYQGDIPDIIKQARGQAGGYDLRVSSRDRDVESRFKVHYRHLIHGEFKKMDKKTQEDNLSRMPVEQEYVSIDAIKSILG